MLDPGDFVLICVVMALVAGAVILLSGLAHRRQLGTGPAGKVRRDRIADGALKREDVTSMLSAENKRLIAQGKRPLSRTEMESRLVGDDSFRHHARLLSWRRKPERTRRVA